LYRGAGTLDPEPTRTIEFWALVEIPAQSITAKRASRGNRRSDRLRESRAVFRVETPGAAFMMSSQD
jgi:hypothetical protein